MYCHGARVIQVVQGAVGASCEKRISHGIKLNVIYLGFIFTGCEVSMCVSQLL